MKLSSLHVEISDLKSRLKPVQKATKAAIRAAQDHPTDLGSTPKYTAVSGPPVPPLPSFTYASHTATSTQSVPATPLGAALGHAASAVLPTPSNFTVYAPHEQVYPTQVRGRMQSVHDRYDTAQPVPGHARR